jgi:hypothetical protein
MMSGTKDDGTPFYSPDIKEADARTEADRKIASEPWSSKQRSKKIKEDHSSE